MLRDDPRIDQQLLYACLASRYGIRASGIRFMPLGFDPQTAIHQVFTEEGDTYFLKTRFGPPKGAALEVPRALTDAGIPHILAPIPTCDGALWASLNDDSGRTVTLFPYLDATDAVDIGLDDEQWRELGRTLRAIHDSGMHERFRDVIRTEAFDLPSAALVRQVSAAVQEWCFISPAAEQFAAFWREHLDRIDAVLMRAMELAAALRSRPFPLVLCHADIHAANILVDAARQLWLVDWDGPLIAPRERDLLFVIGSRIAREVQPHEEHRFFEGYGDTGIDADALRYFRYERIIEDLGEIGKSIFFTPNRSEAVREDEAALARRFFAADGDLDRAERVRFAGNGVRA